MRFSKGSVPVVWTVSLLACGPADEPAERPYVFTSLEYPGATSTVASGINEDGDIAGWYVTDGVMKGFIYHDGTFAPVEYPGARRTQLNDIGADGSAVGAYRNEGEPAVAFHPFLMTPAGEFVDVGHPEHAYGMAQRILPDGTILGCYHDTDFTTTMRAITVSNGEINVRDVPGGMHNGATPDGRKVVGVLFIGQLSYLAEDERITYLEAPGSSKTEAWDINADGVIVGLQIDTAQVTRGFVLENDHWSTIEAPDAQSTVVFGINARSEIVGTWVDAEGVSRGFVAARR